MRNEPDADFEEYLAAVAVARIILGPRMRIRAPPNLSRPDHFALLLAAGVDDWGGVSPVTPDHVNPERPRPEIERLTELTAEAGFELRERLTVHPEHALAGDPRLDPRVVPHVRALMDPATGLAKTGVRAAGLPGRSPTESGSRPDAPICTPRSTPSAGSRTRAATSTRRTATGRCSGSRSRSPTGSSQDWSRTSRRRCGRPSGIQLRSPTTKHSP
ncbi:hypothetical protein [Nocardioides sp. B-3]|uniref:hypothetical protein n=1 Tax=Nocardioides sp. B-3 TaxID=2895565 RepID=UPI00300E0BAB